MVHAQIIPVSEIKMLMYVQRTLYFVVYWEGKGSPSL